MNFTLFTLVAAPLFCAALTYLGIWLANNNRQQKTADARNWITTLLNAMIFIFITACFLAIDSLPDIVGNSNLYAGHAYDVYHYCLLVGVGLLAIIIGTRMQTHFVAAGWIFGGWILFINNVLGLYRFDYFFYKTSESILASNGALPIILFILLRALPPLLLIAFAYWYDQDGKKLPNKPINELPWLRGTALVITLIFGIARSLDILFSRLDWMMKEFQLQRTLKVIEGAQKSLEDMTELLRSELVQCNPWLSIPHFLIGLALVALGFRAKKEPIRVGFIMAGWMTSGHALKNCFGPNYQLVFGIVSLVCLAYFYYKRYSPGLFYRK